MEMKFAYIYFLWRERDFKKCSERAKSMVSKQRKLYCRYSEIAFGGRSKEVESQKPKLEEPNFRDQNFKERYLKELNSQKTIFEHSNFK